jgi:hypothetical protein
VQTVSPELAAAIAGQERYPAVRVIADWNDNGLFDHPDADITSMVKDHTINRGVSTYAPDDLNAGSNGYSSGELTLNLGGGSSTSSGLPAYAFFASSQSPLAGNDLTMARIEVFSRFETSAGWQELRVFSGFIREFTARRQARTVTVVANDHLDMVNANVTLPLWAVGVNSPYATWNGGNAKAARSILLSWCWEETLRQAGRLTAPPIRSDALAHWTFSGSMLPSVGRLVDGWATGPFVNLPSFDPVGYVGDAPFGWGLPYQASDFSTALCTGSTYVKVPMTNDTSQSPKTLGASGWFYVNPADSSGIISSTILYLEKTNVLDDGTQQDNRARFTLAVAADGSMAAAITSGQPSSGSATYNRIDRTATIGTAGWHHYAATVDVNAPGFTWHIYIDGTAVTGTVTSTTTTYISLAAAGQGLNDDSRTNLCRYVGSLPAAGVTIWSSTVASGNGAPTAAQRTLPTLPNGSPMVNRSRSLTEISWIPDTQNANVWDTLKTIVGAEYGGLWTDANGTVHLASRSQIAATLSSSVGAGVPTFDDSVLGEVELTPRADTKKNSVTVPGRYRNCIEKFVWTSQGALDYPTAANQVWNVSYPLTNVTAVNQRLTTDADGIPPGTSDVVDIRTTSSSAVKQSNTSVLATGGWAVNVRGYDNQRGFTLFGQGNALEATYIGSYIGGQQPSIIVAGRVYSDVQLISSSSTNSADVAIYGPRNYNVPENDWVQTGASTAAIALNLANSYVHGVVQISDIELPHDPRRELFDVIGITGAETLTGNITAQIIGIDTKVSGSGFRDTLHLLVVGTPGGALWDNTVQGWESNWSA